MLKIPYYPAPTHLRGAIHAQIGSKRPREWRRPAFIMASAALVVIAFASGWTLQRRVSTPTDVDAIVASHVRSLMLPGHLTDVMSSDQHTVKPWFTGRVDFSPPVTDFAAQGFPLLGGRLDYLGGRPVAALVYGRRLHRINVYIGPSTGDGKSVSQVSRQGFTILRWSSSGFDYTAVSDVNGSDLRELARLISAS